MFVHSIDMNGTHDILTIDKFGTMFASTLASNQFNNIPMRTTPSIITAALALVILTSLVGLTQVHEWTQFAAFTFAIVISLGMLGLVATEK